MKILIFEGISSSGKSTVIKNIATSIPGKVIVRGESFTHIPIMHQTKNLCLEFFSKLVAEAIKSKADVLIFDRLYITQAFRAGVTLDKYQSIEQMLLSLESLTVFLKINEAAIPSRIAESVAQRNPSWGEYVGTKGKTIKEQAEYYVSQQRGLLKLLNQSKINSQIYDSTNHDYDFVAQELIKSIEFTAN